MERHVKERLIGAAVLMAAAIVLIPEMLSGPERKEARPEAQVKTDAPLKTYTIDLQQQAKPATASVVEEPAPPPEEAPPIADAAAPVQAEPPKAIPESSATTASASTPTPPAQAPASPPRAVGSGRWAVQLISYAREETARQLAEKMTRAGHAAFVMPVRSGAATLYRVRIGPMDDRASAEATLSALKAQWPGAVVATQP